MKNIIVTGTSRGIGLELALQLAAKGHRVLALSRTIPQALLGNENISCLSVDLANESDLQKVADYLNGTWKQVDAVIHNAGSLV
jgi:NAD(P)-dependent dehydrogenase (short-subunit alcohol dehydrogenase family)